MRRLFTLGSLPLLLLLPGCNLVLPLTAASPDGSADGATPRDAVRDGQPDRPLGDHGADGDHGPTDQLTPDTGVSLDMQPQDQSATDLGLPPDAPPDLSPPQPDGMPTDKGAPTKDQAPADLPLHPACAGGSWAWWASPEVAGKEMALCTDGKVGNQCTASGRCATGYHLCSGSEYLARGGAGIPFGLAAWIGDCLVLGSGNKGYALSGSACVSNGCTTQLPSTSTPLYWTCGSITADAMGHVEEYGVMTSIDCHYLGINNDSATGGFWIAVAPQNSYPTASACCN